MTHKECSQGLIHICLLSAVALTLAVLEAELLLGPETDRARSQTSSSDSK